MLHSSIALIRAAGSCFEGIERTQLNLRHLHAGNEEARFTVSAVLECGGLDDAIWTLRAVPTEEIGESNRVCWSFSTECVTHAVRAAQVPADAKHVTLVLRVARLRAEGRLWPERSSRLWRKLRRRASGSYIRRAARATLFPGCASEAARHAAASSARAVVERGGAADEERLWQINCLARLLIGGLSDSSNAAMQRTNLSVGHRYSVLRHRTAT
jgi:hypothetical protein